MRLTIVTSVLAAVLSLSCCNEVECLASRAPPRIRALKQVSSDPLAFTIDDFCDAPTCAGLSQNSDEARLHFATLVAGELFAGQWGRCDGLRYNLSESSDANNLQVDDGSVGMGGQCAEGLHVDTNNGSPFRSVTAILYLNDVPEECGAGTVFPLAGADSDDARLQASQRLLREEICHTRGSAYRLEDGSDGGSDGGSGGSLKLTPTQEADAALLESVESTTASGEGLRIQPQAGRLLIFFSRMDDGQIDPRSWHGGERLLPAESESGLPSTSSAVVEKKIVTLFKEVSYGTTPEHPPSFVGRDAFEKYLATQVSEQRRSLKALAESHAPFFEQ